MRREDRYLTVAEAARYMRCGTPKVEGLLVRGVLRQRGQIVGRRLVDKREIDALMGSPAWDGRG